MEKKINKKALIISLILALVCCALLYTKISKINETQPVISQVKMLVASRNINTGEEVKAEDIHTVDISADSLPIGIINDRKIIEGFYASEPIIMGEPFRQERLAKKEEMTLAFNIPDGMRALSIFVNENTLFSNQLKVGDRVDVIANFTKPGASEEDKSNNISKIIIQNLEILSIGPSRMNKKTGNAGTDSEEGNLPQTVTLSVTPGDAEKMAFTTAFADYTLALRGYSDDKKINSTGVTLDYLAQ